MKIALLGLAVGMLVAGAGCGNVCNRLDNATNTRNTKKKNCDSIANKNFDLQQCNDNLSKCSGDDVKALDNYASCEENLPICQSTAPASFQAADVGCLQAVQNSGQCAVDVGIGL